MTAMPAEVKDLFEKVPAVVLSTATKEGQPNSCVVGMKSVIDEETIYLSDQFFKKTLTNMQANDKVAVLFWGGARRIPDLRHRKLRE